MEIPEQRACRDREEKREIMEILDQNACWDQEEQRETRGSLGQKACRDGLGNGSPGKSASAPQVMLSQAHQTRDEGGNMAFYCTVRGNPPPTVEWRFKGKKLLLGAKYLIKVGEFIVKNLNYRDAGQYTCHAKNILGSSEATGSLYVRGKSCLVMINIRDRKQPGRVCGRRREKTSEVWVENVVQSGKNKCLSKLPSRLVAEVGRLH